MRCCARHGTVRDLAGCRWSRRHPGAATGALIFFYLTRSSHGRVDYRTGCARSLAGGCPLPRRGGTGRGLVRGPPGTVEANKLAAAARAATSPERADLLHV